MARDGMGAIQIKKTQAGAATNTAQWTFTFSGDCNNAKAIELRQLTVACEEAAGSVSPNLFNPYVLIITQTSSKLVFESDRYNGAPTGFVWPDGVDLLASDGDTVTVTLNAQAAGNSTTRHLFIRALLRAI